MKSDLRDLLNGKKVLLICPKYFGYEREIFNRLIEHGAAVSYVDERPANSTLAKGLIRLFPFMYGINTVNYYRKEIREMNQCDIVLVINPESLSLPILNKIKMAVNASEYILYMWDSFSNKKRAKHLVPFFDRVLTFDPVDAEDLNIIFRPLFFLSGSENSDICRETIDISFVGTGHSDRVKTLKKIGEQCKELNLRYCFYAYLQSRLIYIFFKITKKAFRGIKSSDFHYKPVTYNEYLRILESSKVVIDIEHPGQKGLTMRTLEVLGKRKKLITTNSLIKSYDFYNDSNISIIDRENPVIPKEFLDRNYQSLPEDLYHKYSVDGWLEDIFLADRPDNA